MRHQPITELGGPRWARAAFGQSRAAPRHRPPVLLGLLGGRTGEPTSTQRLLTVAVWPSASQYSRLPLCATATASHRSIPLIAASGTWSGSDTPCSATTSVVSQPPPTTTTITPPGLVACSPSPPTHSLTRPSSTTASAHPHAQMHASPKQGRVLYCFISSEQPLPSIRFSLPSTTTAVKSRTAPTASSASSWLPGGSALQLLIASLWDLGGCGRWHQPRLGPPPHTRIRQIIVTPHEWPGQSRMSCGSWAAPHIHHPVRPQVRVGPWVSPKPHQNSLDRSCMQE